MVLLLLLLLLQQVLPQRLALQQQVQVPLRLPPLRH
jgi:hypothetical protein